MHNRIITTITLLFLIVLLCESSPELNQVSRSISTRDLNGTFSEKTGDSHFTAYIEWSAVQDAKAMTSTITAEFYVVKTGNCGYFVQSFKNPNRQSYTITIDGQKRSGDAHFRFPRDAPDGTKQNISTFSNTVMHNADGTKSVTISATLESVSPLGTFTVSGTAKLDPFTVVVKVTFNGNGGTPSETTRDVTYREKYGALPVATKTGYAFIGWFTSVGAEIRSSSIVNIANEHILYAQWSINTYTISFNTNGGSSCFPITQNYNTTLTLPSTAKAGHTFDYWCSDSALTSRYTASTMPPENIVLYAKYTINSYTVTFLSDGSVVKSEQLDYQSNITHPGNLTKTGYSLVGWNSSITSVPDHNVVIDALWAPNVYVVEFDPNGGDELANKTMGVTYDDVYGELPEATREGHTFLGWFTNATDGCEITSNSTVKIAGNHTLYAHWSIISYTLTFDFCNGTIIYVIIEFNKEINYPKNLTREGHRFIGWEKGDLERMPAKNVTVTALWKGSSKSIALSPFGLAMVVSVLVLVIIVVVVFITVAFIRRKKPDSDANEENIELGKPLIADDDSFDGYTRIIAVSKDEVEDVVSISASKSALIHIYPQGYTRPTMQEALAEVDLSKKQIELICSACENAVKAIADEGKLFEGFTEKDAASIAMYTYDFGPDGFESNPFRIINRSLAERSFANLQRASGLLYLVMTALRKLPRYTGVTLYRGVLGELNLDKDHYYVGNVITWSALSSTSPNMEETKRFLARGSKSEKAIKTLFIIEGGWGYNIQPYSLFTDEVEILLEPERRFKVTNVVVSEITVISLKMLNTPLILPEVFGDVW